LTQEELAAKARVTREYVSRLEREEYSPTLKMLLRICAAIGTPAWEIIRRVESHKPTQGG
jgi:transcriptional regulator with XRE-family HTH domain